MKEDYLWDKSGEVDTEIEELENVLGRLRYKPLAQPLPLPAVSRSWFRLNSTSLAAAAALALLLLAGGLWLGLNRSSSADTTIGSGPPPTTGPVSTTGGFAAVVENTRSPEPVSAPTPQVAVIPRAPVEHRQYVQVTYSETKRARERREEQQFIRRGEQAKEQLIKALQITSDKLSVAQKKIQGARDSGPIS